MVCKVDGKTFNFGVGNSTYGVGAFDTWPVIDWPLTEGSKAIRLEPREKSKQDQEIDAPINQEELDDIEGYLHIHTLPPERRKQIIEQLKNKKE